MGASKPTAGDVQRLFLQAVMSRRVVSEKLGRTLWQKCVEAVKAADNGLDVISDDSAAQWHKFLERLNRSLDSLDMEFRTAMDEAMGVKMYALVNRKDDEIAQVATDYNATEIAYFKAIVEQIMLSPNQAYSLSSLAALREVSSLKGTMSKTQAEVVLGSFVANGWLLKSRKGRYSMSTRTLLELQPYLRQTFAEEILECTICMDIVTKGYTCNKDNCHTYLHNHCYQNLCRQRSTCPTCQQNWGDDGVSPIGEDAAKEGQDSKRRTRRRSVDEADDEEDQLMEESQEFAEQAQSNKATPEGTQNTQRQEGTNRQRRRRSADSAEDEVDESFNNATEDDAMDIDNLNEGRRGHRNR